MLINIIIHDINLNTILLLLLLLKYSNNCIHQDRMRVIRKITFGMVLTFHRAFDVSKEPLQALNDIIDLKCDRLLTSGCENTAFEGIECLQQLVETADGSIQIIAGCGLNADNVSSVIRKTGVQGVHAGSSVCISQFHQMHSTRNSTLLDVFSGGFVQWEQADQTRVEKFVRSAQSAWARGKLSFSTNSSRNSLQSNHSLEGS